MRRVMVIPVYYSRPKSEGHQDGDSVYDHPTPIDEDGTLKRTLESIRIIKNQDFQLVNHAETGRWAIFDQLEQMKSARGF